MDRSKPAQFFVADSPTKDKMANRQPLPPRHHPRTPENERAEIITHEPASWNSYRQTSSRGQLVRDFMESGLPEARAKVRVEEEFTARKPRIAPPRRRPSLTPMVRTSRTTKTEQSDESERSSRRRDPSPSRTRRSRNSSPAPTASSSRTMRSSRTRNPSPAPTASTYRTTRTEKTRQPSPSPALNASRMPRSSRRRDPSPASTTRTSRTRNTSPASTATSYQSRDPSPRANIRKWQTGMSSSTSTSGSSRSRDISPRSTVRKSRSRAPSQTPSDSTVRPSRSQQKKPAARNLSPASEKERRRLRQKLLDEGTPVDMVNEMKNGLSVSDSSRSRESSPAPTSRSHAMSSSRQSGPQRRGRSRSPYIDPSPPIEEMSLNMLRQEVAEEGRDQGFIDFLLLRGANLGSLNTGTSNSSARARMRSRDRDAIPLGLVWSDDPVKEREMRRASLIEHGFPARGVKLFLDEQWGPAAPASLALAARNPVYAEHGCDIKVEGNAVVEREKQRQAVLESDFLHQSEKGIRLMLDEIYGPETREARAHRKPGPDWMRDFAIMKLRYGSHPDDNSKPNSNPSSAVASFSQRQASSPSSSSYVPLPPWDPYSSSSSSIFQIPFPPWPHRSPSTQPTFYGPQPPITWDDHLGWMMNGMPIDWNPPMGWNP
ncbi:hypothetical protein WAI453_012655 [Rhynchosporium graminicola]